jgi:hypothetical protein
MKWLHAAIALLFAGFTDAASASMARPPLDAFLAFANPRRCEQAPAHSKFLAAMVIGKGNFRLRPGQIRVPAKLRSAFGDIEMKRTKDWTKVRVPVRGTLFGLPLVEIEQDFPAGGDPPDVSYSFAAPTTVVERAAKRHGFLARAGHLVPLGAEGVYDISVYLASDPDHAGHSILTCGIG